jgi:hypothetical protein
MLTRRSFLISSVALLTTGGLSFLAFQQKLRERRLTDMVGPRDPITAPLVRHPQNPRYFANGSGAAVLLTGSHYWYLMQDRSDIPEADYADFLAMLDTHHHNFLRLWTWEQATWHPVVEDRFSLTPTVYARTGPGSALDGEPRFDLTRFNDAFFERLREIIVAAGQRNIYVAVMLFQGWSVGRKALRNGNPWPGHPYHRENNINGIDGDPQNTGEGRAVHTLQIAEVTALQEDYARKVIDTLNDLDNVLWEISNESHAESLEWQEYMTAFIRDYEATLPKQHPIGITVPYSFGDNPNEILFRTNADWVSPHQNEDLGYDYMDDPPVSDGRKVVISDTDHLWGVGGDREWVWKSVLRGLHPIYMDPFTHPAYDEDPEDVRRNMGYAALFARRLDLATMDVRGDLASTSYCLAHVADDAPAYLVYLPEGGAVEIDLSATSGTLSVEWCNPRTGSVLVGDDVQAGAPRTLHPLFRRDVVLLLHRSV